jgi:ubiquinone/menaquinone biosynthesis C-methylase UbiE
LNEQIKKYWDTRAIENAQSSETTTNDVYLRELEICTLIQAIKDTGLSEGTILDAGCGDGYSTIRISKELTTFRFVGIDYSENMIEIAQRRLREDGNPGTIEFIVADIEKLFPSFHSRKFDIVITDRCLINLDSTKAQYEVMRQIQQMLKPSGYYIAIENFLEGQKKLTELRQAVGLPEIPIRWHNLFFDESDFIAFAKSIFCFVRVVNFSSAYYFATRVIYSLLCKIRNEQPDYRHEVHRLSVNLPFVGDCSPIKLVIMQRKDI